MIDWETTPRTLHRQLGSAAPPVLLDVRTTEEWDLVRLDGAVHIPLHELPRRLVELDPSRDTVVYCHSGIRSAQAAFFLLQNGFGRVRHLRGGIDAWAAEVDPSLPRY